MNFKKSILSLATIMALGNTVLADSTATYLPLTSDTVDASWVLFGVNGFSTGVPSTSATVQSAFTAGYTSVTETSVVDSLATSGISSAYGAVTGNLVSIQEIAALPDLAIAVDIDTDLIPFIPEEAARSMYVKVTGTVADIKIDYKTSLEGKTMEILVNGVVYTATFSQDNTWSNAQQAVAGSSGSTSGGTDIKSVTGVLDFDFTDNPVNANDYNATSDLTAATAGASSFYYFNSVNQQWEVNQKGAVFQDFTNFNVGKAYWGRVDDVDTLAGLDNDGDSPRSGLVLGQATQASGLPDPDRYQDDLNVSTLTTGWNMLSFDDSEPYIRHAATGLVVGGVIAAIDTYTLTDASGLHSVTSAAVGAGVTAADMATFAENFNQQIESLKLRGLLPKSFNIKVFGTGAASQFVVISDQKFYIDSTAAGAVTATSLAGQNPYILGVDTVATTDINVQSASATDIESRYGEYSLMFKPLVGATSADNEGAPAGYSKVVVDTASIASESVVMSAVATATSVATTLAANTTSATDVGTAIDTNFDGTADMVILANTETFTIADGTYTKVFSWDNTSAGTQAYTVVGSTDSAITTTALDTATDVAGDIDGVFAATGVRAADIDATTLALYSVATSNLDIKDAPHTSIDHFDKTTSTSDFAKGAISGVYSLDGVARTSLNQVTITADTFTVAAGGTYILDDAADDFSVTVNGGAVTTRAASSLGAAMGIVTTYGDLLGMYDDIVTVINERCVAQTEHCSASHDFAYPAGVISTTDLPVATTVLPTTITITGVDVASLALIFVDGGTAADQVNPTVNAASGDNLIDVSVPDLKADLKSNAVATPNFAKYGPLYTLRDSGTGYDVRAILKATTDMDTANGVATTTNTIAWDSIDITRNENDWFANNEFNLFGIDQDAGYWVYLENAATADITIGTPTFSKTYSYYFSDDSAATPAYPTTNIITAGQLSVTITNLNDGTGEAGSAYAVIGAEEIQLRRSGTSDTFTGNISDYALASFIETATPVDVRIRAVDGKGNAVAVDSALTIDYAKPTGVTASMLTGTTINVDVDQNVTNVYVFNGYIPELSASRVSPILVKTVALSGSNTTSFNACAEFTWGAENTLRIVAADGTIGSANVSDADQIIYSSILKGAHVLTHTEGSIDIQTSIGAVYDSTCTLSATQPSLTTDNDGVSVASISSGSGIVARLAFIPITGQSFEQSFPWTSNYEINNGDGAIIQINNNPAYAGKTFYVEYDSTIYKSTFPATQAAAEATIVDPTDLVGTFTGANTSLLP